MDLDIEEKDGAVEPNDVVVHPPSSTDRYSNSNEDHASEDEDDDKNGDGSLDNVVNDIPNNTNGNGNPGFDQREGINEDNLIPNTVVSKSRGRKKGTTVTVPPNPNTISVDNTVLQEMVGAAVDTDTKKWSTVHSATSSGTFFIDVDVVDKALLAQAKEEINSTVQNLKNQLRKDDISAFDLFNFWLDLDLSKDLLGFMSKTSSIKWSREDIILFMITELYLGIYKCSPSIYYGDNSDGIYHHFDFEMSHYKYKLFLKAISSNPSARTSTTSDLQWEQPFSLDVDISDMYKNFRKFCCKHGSFGKGVITIDDDFLRLSSPQVQMSGFAQTKNDRKGYVYLVSFCFLS